MGFIKNALIRFGIMGELLSFLWKRKLWWLIPAIVVLLFLGLIMILAEGTAVGPFIYTLF